MLRSSRPLGLAALSLTMLLGCVPVPPFTCTGNDSCVSSAGAQGICEADARCSFPDDACPGSRRRYANVASAKGSCVPAGKRCVQQLAMGSKHSCLLRDDGAVYCWGDNTDGKLGDGTTVGKSVPTLVQGLPLGAVSIGAGEYHTCAVLKDDSVWCWGGNDAYELGQGTNVLGSSVPLRVLMTNDLPDGGQTPRFHFPPSPSPWAEPIRARSATVWPSAGARTSREAMAGSAAATRRWSTTSASRGRCLP